MLFRSALILLLWTSTFAQAPDWVQSADLHDSPRSAIGVYVHLDSVEPETFPTYFPLQQTGRDAASNAAALDPFRNAWYSKVLAHMHEPVLVGDSSGREIYRFTCIRAFREPIVVRIENIGNYIVINYSIFEYNDCYDYYGYYNQDCDFDYICVPQDKALLLPAQRWDEVQAQIQQIGFWALPSEDPTELGFDGSDWILEGSLKGKYHVTTRWSPDPGNAYRDCCLFLLGLSGVNVSVLKEY